MRCQAALYPEANPWQGVALAAAALWCPGILLAGARLKRHDHFLVTRTVLPDGYRLPVLRMRQALL